MAAPRNSFIWGGGGPRMPVDPFPFQQGYGGGFAGGGNTQAAPLNSSAPGSVSQDYDPYGFAAGTYANAAELINGPQGELNDTIIPGSDETPLSAFRWLLAWAVLILVLTLFNRTRLGHALIYYGVILLLMILVVTNYGWYAWALAPFTRLNQALSGRQSAQEAAASGQPDTSTPAGQALAEAIAEARQQATPGTGPLEAGTTYPSSRFIPTQFSLGSLPRQ